MIKGGFIFRTLIYDNKEEYKKRNKSFIDRDTNWTEVYSHSVEWGNMFSHEDGSLKEEDYYIATLAIGYKIPREFWISREEAESGFYRGYKILYIKESYPRSVLAVYADYYLITKYIVIYVPYVIYKNTKDIVEYFLNEYYFASKTIDILANEDSIPAFINSISLFNKLSVIDKTAFTYNIVELYDLYLYMHYMNKVDSKIRADIGNSKSDRSYQLLKLYEDEYL